MSSGKISLLSQPAHVIAHRGSELAVDVMDALREWLGSARIFETYSVRGSRKRAGRQLAPVEIGRQADRVKVIKFGRGCIVCYVASSEPNLYVCGIEMGSWKPAQAMLHAASALGAVDHINPEVTFSLEAAYDVIVDAARLNSWPSGADNCEEIYRSTHDMDETNFHRDALGSTTASRSIEDQSDAQVNVGFETVKWFAAHAEPLAELKLSAPRRSPMPGPLPRLS